MAEFKKRSDEFETYQATIFALSADAIKPSSEFKAEMKLPFTLLCDDDRQVISQYGILNPDEHDGIAYPSVFILDNQVRVRYRSLDKTYHRVDLSEILTFLADIQNDPEVSRYASSVKNFVKPTPASLTQLTRNMIFRGDIRDWKHYLLFLLRPITRLFKGQTRK